ncbi:MAG: SPASM domain-containing protein, partial [Lentisphaerota bacterium]
VKALGPFKDVEDFKTKLKDNMKLEKENQFKEKTRLKIVEKIIDDTNADLPEILIESELSKILYRMESDITQMGLKFEDYLKHINKTIEDLKKEFGSFVSGSLLQLMESVKAINENEVPASNDEKTITVQPCGAAVNQCAIRPDGDVLPCVLLYNTPSGNVLHTPFKEIWDHSDTLNQFRSDFTLTEKEIGTCISCKYSPVCYTGHRCSPYFIPGGINNKKLFCIKNWM